MGDALAAQNRALCLFQHSDTAPWLERWVYCCASSAATHCICLASCCAADEEEQQEAEAEQEAAAKPAARRRKPQAKAGGAANADDDSGPLGLPLQLNKTLSGVLGMLWCGGEWRGLTLALQSILIRHHRASSEVKRFAVGPRAVVALGEVEWLHPAFHNEKAIFPPGYCAERLTSECCVEECRVL